jgi:hypothetical protein
MLLLNLGESVYRILINKKLPCLYVCVSTKVLPKLKIAHIIGKAVWDQRGDIRDVISIGKLVRKSDGPVEVESILSTMAKYIESIEK